MSKKYSLIKNKLGYYEVSPKPTIEELNDHYNNKYYQYDKSIYEKSYTKDELRYFDVEAEIALNTFKRFSNVKKSKLLDLGCGEGFFSNFFKKSGWDVRCIDFSDDGIKRHNPSLLSDFVQGDLLKYLDKSGSNIHKFDLINLDNVLEHVIDPVQLLRKINSKIKPSSIIRVDVPHDFSRFQSLLVERELTKETWVCPPEHLSYFNNESLKKLLKVEGFNLLSLQADYPIEQFLLNKITNYWDDRSLGKSAHFSRVIVTNYMADISIERMIDYREAAADLEFGRSLIVYFTLNK